MVINEVCNFCGGTGVIIRIANNSRSLEGHNMTKIVCPNCSGLGYLDYILIDKKENRDRVNDMEM